MKTVALSTITFLFILITACKTSIQKPKVQVIEKTETSNNSSKLTEGQAIDTLNWYYSGDFLKDSVPSNSYLIIQRWKWEL